MFNYPAILKFCPVYLPETIFQDQVLQVILYNPYYLFGQ